VARAPLWMKLILRSSGSCARGNHSIFSKAYPSTEKIPSGRSEKIFHCVCPSIILTFVLPPFLLLLLLMWLTGLCVLLISKVLEAGTNRVDPQFHQIYHPD